MRRIIRILALLIFSLAILASCNNSIDASLFLYISSSNLESQFNAASRMLDKLKEAKNLKIYGLAGGTYKWENPQFTKDKANLFKIEDGNLEILEVSEKNMADLSTLKEFISFSKEIKSASKSLLFWGHGSPYGILKDDLYDNDLLSYSEVSEGLGDSFFDFIIFNSCYCANLDLMSFIAKNAKYAIASVNALSSAGLDYDSLAKELTSNKDLFSKGKAIIDLTANKYEKIGGKDNLTLSLIDLELLRENTDKLALFFKGLKYDFANFFKAINQSYRVNSDGRDLLDILNTYSNSNVLIKELIEKIISYSYRGNNSSSSGLYLYYLEEFNGKEYQLYKDNAYYNDYLTLMKERINYENNNFISFKTMPSLENYLYNIKIPNFDYLAFLSYALYDFSNNLIKEDIKGLDLKVNKQNQLEIALKPEALSQYSLAGLRLSTEYYTEEANKITYTAPAIINDKDVSIFFSHDLKDNSLKILGYSAYDYLMLNSLAQGDRIKIGNEEIIYNLENIMASKIKEAKIIVIAQDIYGKQYFSNLDKIKSKEI